MGKGGIRTRPLGPGDLGVASKSELGGCWPRLGGCGTLVKQADVLLTLVGRMLLSVCDGTGYYA